MWITSLFWLLSAVAWAGSPPGNPPGRTGAPNALSIGNRLFQDYNRNGIQDATDPGIANVPVYLYENGVLRGSTTSAADGSYQFSSTNVTNGLKASTAYEVRVLRSDFPSGMSLTRQNVNGNANDATDSDAQLVGNLAVISVTTSGSDQASNNNDFGFSAGDPDLSITKTSNVSSVTLGSNVSFTIQVTNVAANATDVATGVTVKDTLDLGLTYVSSSPAATVSTVGSGSATQTVLTWSLGTISGANSSSTVTVTATANAEGVLFNTAYVTADPSSGLPEFNVSNNVSRACVTVPVKLCAGEGYVASIPASFSNVTWYRGNTQVATGNSYTITQAGSYSYTASGTGGCGASSCCPIVVEDGVIPTLAITPSNPAICAGTSVSLTASATGVGSSAGTMTWSDGTTVAANTSTIVRTPVSTTAYSVTFTSSEYGTCSASTSTTVTVNPNPVVTLTSATICAGTTATLSASVAAAGTYTYAFSTGLTPTAPGSVSATTAALTTAGTFPYSVTATSAEGCSSTAVASVTVNPNPVVTLTSATICAGTTATLSASVAAAGTYTYAFSSGLTPTAPGSASATTAALTTAGSFPYSVTATSAEGCSSTATASVTVNPNPVVTLTSATICAGTTATLSASVAAAGTYTYAFSTGLTPTAAGSADATTGVLSATGTTTYSVTAISAEGCSSTAVASVTVDPNPVATITASSLTACQGTNILLTATGGNTFSWSTGETTASISVTVSGTYSVTVGNATTGCTSTTNVTVTVLPTPVLAVTTSAPSATLCAGVSTTLTVSGCSGNVVWSTGDTGASLLVQPLVTTTYSLTCTLSTGCSATTAVTVNVNDAPAFDDPATVTAATCAGATANNDAAIAFATLRNTAKAAYSMGTTYTGPDFNGATAVSSNSITFNGLANPNTRQAYTVRLYSAGGSCFTDVVVYLNPAQCICPTPKCVPVVIRKTR
ncbi:SdrD B-like domain-containing protein [uncultured Spirosoma sp.]|uniref:SdrD B-like domain-containing protein n=1 Tax=uncultured Spirosoma sp. TaxID=278208 RepID=UPI002590632E|nr:SdrD B-like domain-containing protein [uncultured Spirosoma sp.]